jgi:hypothetical protein
MTLWRHNTHDDICRPRAVLGLQGAASRRTPWHAAHHSTKGRSWVTTDTGEVEGMRFRLGDELISLIGSWVLTFMSLEVAARDPFFATSAEDRSVPIVKQAAPATRALSADSVTPTRKPKTLAYAIECLTI